ncbi:hypothetical protein AL036_12605 [Salipiger aestuarii]|uniref:Uncharacterized protein n=1 Tax=Salipiger aestuarii TaxID=568098 RepID=A0A327Y2D9_9RHOB|nr:hypothetical protein [Salipiger aestuarii]EIE50246.1 hypothetical protein C357_14901 [Citreicella sp. 357]KAA8606910.1 hypothetical protein AL036_12605 [Salipiger aestuarii]KAA8610806.1 hypothetical protein AL037_12060 [Salipiger aestuarii]KAB2541590.1 hypothetical protein AL035_11625 [Salipiger aestuarii]RAK14216.1 hypothetical protein ATI53_102817 [Salipiger aestuarii]
MSIQKVARQALSAYARSKTRGRVGHPGAPLRNRPLRKTRVKRGRNPQTQLASKAMRGLRRLF